MPWHIGKGNWYLFSLILNYFIFPIPLMIAQTQPHDQSARLPTIKQVAILPVYWQSQFSDQEPFKTIKQRINSNFPEIIRSSKRFYFTNDRITTDLWSSPEGRKDLEENYEIDAFLNLTVSTQNDLIIWTTRLLSPRMENFLTETERVPIAWAASSTPEEMDDRLRRLIFRMLNRYPIDVFVTSIQGRYISLSGGKEQLIFEGNELNFFQTIIRSKHPIDGSWLQFERKNLGTATIIQSNEQSSVAYLSSLSFEDAIKIGDGATVEASATRRVFQNGPVDKPKYQAIAENNPLVEPEGSWQDPMKKTQKTAQKTKAHHPEKPNKNSDLEAGRSIPSTEAKTEDQNTQEISTNPPQYEAEVSNDKNSDKEVSAPLTVLKDLMVTGQSQNFSFTRSASARSKSSSVLLNLLEAKGTYDLSSDLVLLGSMSFGFGSTSKGSYSGFSFRAEPSYSFPILSAAIPSINRFLLGTSLQFESLGINKQTFGGWDLFSVAPSAHLQGSLHLTESTQTIDYDINLRMNLLSSGTAGIAGKKKDLDSINMTEWETIATLRTTPKDTEWGGVIAGRFGDSKLGSKSLDFESLSFGVVARLRI